MFLSKEIVAIVDAILLFIIFKRKYFVVAAFAKKTPMPV